MKSSLTSGTTGTVQISNLRVECPRLPPSSDPAVQKHQVSNTADTRSDAWYCCSGS